MAQVWQRVKGWLGSSLPWWLLVVLGAVLRLRQYAANRSLWADEASLAVNLANRTFGELTRLLDYHQAAPVGFLFIEKSLVVTLGNHDYVMRLFPLFAGLLALYLAYRIGRAHFGAAGLFALGLVAISYWLVYYASELKQYSSDVMAGLLLVYLGMRCVGEAARGRDYVILGGVGALAVWVSHPSVFVLAGIGLALLVRQARRQGSTPLVWVMGIGLVWLLSFGLEYLVSLRHIVADGYLIRYWEKAYVPVPPWGNWGWFEKTYHAFLFISLHRTDRALSLLFLVLVGIGALWLLVRNMDLALVLLSPFGTVLLASALQRYPLQYRFMLFLAPFAFLLMAAGLQGLYFLVAKFSRALALASAYSLALAVFWMLAPYTFRVFSNPGKSDVRPALQFIAENKAEDDIIYVFHAADPVFNYYAPFYGLNTGNVIVGFDTNRKRVALQGFYDDVESLRGEDRVWFFFAEILDCPACENDQQSFYVDYVNGFGSMLDHFDGPGANAYLYDLNP